MTDVTNPHLKAFLLFLKTEKKYSDHTISAYRGDLESFFEFTGISLHQVNNVELNDLTLRWTYHMRTSGNIDRSIRRRLSALASLIKFVMRRSLVTQKLQVVVKRRGRGAAQQVPKPTYIGLRKMQRVLDGDYTKDLEGQTDRLVIKTFYMTGIRLAEMTEVKLTSVDLRNKSLKVLGKGKKERTIPLHESHVDEIKNYLALRKKMLVNNSCDYLFVTKRGRKYSRVKIFSVVKTHLLRITGTAYSPHVLRHTFAQHIIDNDGSDLYMLQGLLGHSTIASTDQYVAVQNKNNKRAHTRYHPLAEDD
jgi:integrase/recombinase XerC